MLRKNLLTGLVALSIAAAPVAAPTATAKDNIDKLLIGLVAVGIAGAIVNEVKHNKKKQKVERHTPVYDPHTEDFHPKKRHVQGDRHRHGNTVHRHKHHSYHDHNQPRGRDAVGVKKHVYKKVQKPRQCLRQRWTNQGWVKFYSKRCLHRHGY